VDSLVDSGAIFETLVSLVSCSVEVGDDGETDSKVEALESCRVSDEACQANPLVWLALGKISVEGVVKSDHCFGFDEAAPKPDLVVG
jgi:hypothetical protein